MCSGKDQRYISQIKNIKFKPIFILGMHRSGTSILYKMLASTGHFNIVTAYHILYYDSLIYNHLKGKEEDVKKRFNQLLRELGQSNRVIDRMKIDANFPEEYGFLLNRVIPTGINKRNLPLFIEMCKKIQFISDIKKPLLLKNPWDFSNFLFVKEVLPESKFIFIHRHPLKVINSSIKALRSLLEKKSIYSELLSKVTQRIYENPLAFNIARLLLSRKLPLGLFILVEFYSRSTKYFVNNISSLQKEDYIEVKYEKLCEDPDATIKKILDFLGFETRQSFKGYINPRSLPISKEINKLKRYIYGRMKHYFSYCNYPIEITGGK